MNKICSLFQWKIKKYKKKLFYLSFSLALNSDLNIFLFLFNKNNYVENDKSRNYNKRKDYMKINYEKNKKKMYLNEFVEKLEIKQKKINH